MKWIHRIGTALVVAAIVSSSVSCNTIKGIGRDIKHRGGAIEDAAEDAQH